VDVLDRLSDAVQKGRTDDVLTLIHAGLEQGLTAQQLLEDGLLKGMALLGERFKTNQAWVPEVLLAARVLNKGIDVLKPRLIEAGLPPRGKAVIGTVEGDLHDVGKNLVKIMFEGSGFEVVDLGTNVPTADFVEAVRDHRPDVLCLSALLTTTIGQMEAVIEAVAAAGLRDHVKILVGGAPVTHDLASRIGADGYAADAAAAADLATQLIVLAG